METAMRDLDAMEVGNRSRCAIWRTIGLYSTYSANLIYPAIRLRHGLSKTLENCFSEGSFSDSCLRIDRTRSRMRPDAISSFGCSETSNCAFSLSTDPSHALRYYPPRTWMWNYHRCQLPPHLLLSLRRLQLLLHVCFFPVRTLNILSP
jgi:hypothetical protein